MCGQLVLGCMLLHTDTFLVRIEDVAAAWCRHGAEVSKVSIRRQGQDWLTRWVFMLGTALGRPGT